MPQDQTKVRVAIQQPALPAYRVSVFHELAQRPKIELKVYYGERKGSPSSVHDVPFESQFVDLKEKKIAGYPVLWHAPQWRCADKRIHDVLVLSWDIHYLSLIPALIRARLRGVGTVLWGHGYSKRDKPWRRWPREQVAKLAGALLFYNKTAADNYREAHQGTDSVFVAPNAIDQSQIQAARQHWLDRADELASFKRENRLEGGPVILFVSRLDPDNRICLLIEALQELIQRYPNAQVVVIGKGDEERSRLTDLAEQAGVLDHIRFLGPIYQEQALAPWFLSATAFCYPANIGLSILHAFGYGLPVITSDRLEAQNPEIESLEHQANGLLYADGSSQALAQAISTLIDDAELHQRLSEHAYHTANTTFSISAMVDGMEAAIHHAAKIASRK